MSRISKIITPEISNNVVMVGIDLIYSRKRRKMFKKQLFCFFQRTEGENFAFSTIFQRWEKLLVDQKHKLSRAVIADHTSNPTT